MSTIKPSKLLGSSGSVGGSMSKPKSALLSSAALRASTPGGTNGTSNGGIHGQQDNDLSDVRVRVGMLEKDLERRQESYIARERAYKARIEDLEEELNAQKALKTGWMNLDSKVMKLKNTHSKILDNVELVQERTARILQDQERDLLRAFRARLFDVQTELEKEKSKKDDGAGAWIERSRQLESEVEWAKEVADRLERVNQALTQENNRLKTQFSSQEEDRNFLIQQLVSVKKDNERLRLEYNAIELELKRLIDQNKYTQSLNSRMGVTPEENNSKKPAGKTGAGAGAGMPGGMAGTDGRTAPTGAAKDADERYKEVNIRLRRLLAEEKKALTVTRNNYAAELRARTEMELLLRTCVEEVRKEIAKRHMESAYSSNPHGNNKTGDFTKLYQGQNAGGNNPNAASGDNNGPTESPIIPIEDFTQEDRERVLELLLSQERVVTLLYSKAFPVAGSAAAAKGTGVQLGGGHLQNMEAEKMPRGGIPMDDFTSNYIAQQSKSSSALPAINKEVAQGGGESWESFF